MEKNNEMAINHSNKRNSLEKRFIPYFQTSIKTLRFAAYTISNIEYLGIIVI